MKKYILLLIVPFLSFGQVWEVFIGESGDMIEAGNSIVRTNENIFSCGYKYNYTNTLGENIWTEIYVTKTDLFGEVIWEKTFGPDASFENRWSAALDMQITNDNNLIICGNWDEVAGTEFIQKVFLLKIDLEGELIWSEQYNAGAEFMYNTCAATSVIESSNGDFLMTGTVLNNSFLLKTDQNGNVLSRVIFENVVLNDIAKTFDGGFIMCGQNLNQGYTFNEKTNEYFPDFNQNNIILIKTNEDGAELWRKHFDLGLPSTITIDGEVINNNCNNDIAHCVKATDDGGYILCGEIRATSSPCGGTNIVLIKTNSDGDTEWAQEYPSEIDENAYSVIQTTNIGYVISGSSYYDQWNTTNLLMKTNENGELEWRSSFGWGYVSDVVETNNQEFLMGGGAWNGESYQLYLAQTYSNPLELGDDIFKNKLLIKTIDILGRDTNQKGFNIEIYDDGSVQKKYVIE